MSITSSYKVTYDDLFKVIETIGIPPQSPPKQLFLTKSIADKVKESFGYLPKEITIIPDEYLPENIKAIATINNEYVRVF